MIYIHLNMIDKIIAYEQWDMTNDEEIEFFA